MEPNKELKGIVADFMDRAAEAAKKSHDDYLAALPAGEQNVHIPSAEQILGSERPLFAEYCKELQAKVDAVIAPLEKAERDIRTAPPTSDAVAVITLLNTRTDITEDEITELIERYGDNYQAKRALINIANRNGIRGLDDPISKYSDTMETLSRSLRSWLTLDTVDRKQATAGYRAIIENQIDVAFGKAAPIFDFR